MSVEGDAEMILNVDKLVKGFDRKARKAVKAGGETFGDDLKGNTPVSAIDHSGKVPLAQNVIVSNVSIASGDYEVKVGYGREKGPIAHFPNSGTSKQDPQHFVEESQVQAKPKILKNFVENLRIDSL